MSRFSHECLLMAVYCGVMKPFLTLSTPYESELCTAGDAGPADMIVSHVRPAAAPTSGATTVTLTGHGFRDWPERLMRCTWKGAHYQPLHGKLGPNVTLKDKHNFFANVVWEFFHRFWVGEGTEKEASLLRGGPTQ